MREPERRTTGMQYSMTRPAEMAAAAIWRWTARAVYTSSEGPTMSSKMEASQSCFHSDTPHSAPWFMRYVQNAPCNHIVTQGTVSARSPSKQQTENEVSFGLSHIKRVCGLLLHHEPKAHLLVLVVGRKVLAVRRQRRSQRVGHGRHAIREHVGAWLPQTHATNFAAR